MALRWLDSFDHYAAADLPDKYDAIADNPTIGAGRWVNALYLQDGNTPDMIRKILTSKQTWVIGAAVRIAVYSANDKPIWRFIDSATTQITLWYQTGTGKLYLNSGFGNTALTTAGLNQNTWYYVEMKVTIANSGSYELRVDGTAVLSGSGVDTQLSGNASADRFELSAGSSGGTSTFRHYDDLYVCDGDIGAGSNPCNDFLGDIRVECLFPNGNGSSSQLVGQDANSTDNYLNVDETISNDDTDYNQSSTIGHKDLYTYTNLTAPSGTVFGVQTNLMARKDDAGLRTLVSVARESGGTEDDGDVKTLSTTYRYHTDIRDVDPDGVDWTIASVNDAEFGMKVNS